MKKISKIENHKSSIEKFSFFYSFFYYASIVLLNRFPFKFKRKLNNNNKKLISKDYKITFKNK